MHPLLRAAVSALSRRGPGGTQAFREGFDDVAVTYDGVVTRPLLGDATERLILSSGLAPGMDCLDLGCGTGHATKLIADRVAPGGSVTGCDFSLPMLERARARCAESAAVSFTFGEMCSFLERGRDASYDFAGLFWSLEYAEHRAVLRGLRRVLRPGGTVAVLVNLRTSLGELQDLVAPILVRRVLSLRRLPALHFLPDAPAFEATAAAAGFRTEHLAEEAIPVRFPTGRELVAWMLNGGPAAGLKSSIRESSRERIFGLISRETDRRGGITATFRYVSYLGRRA